MTLRDDGDYRVWSQSSSDYQVHSQPTELFKFESLNKTPNDCSWVIFDGSKMRYVITEELLICLNR